jgi:hypothetical protein
MKDKLGWIIGATGDARHGQKNRQRLPRLNQRVLALGETGRWGEKRRKLPVSGEPADEKKKGGAVRPKYGCFGTF